MVRIPPFSRVFEVLCQGAGLVTAVADGFSGLRSYESKQKLFFRESNGVKQGLLQDLLRYLTDEDKALADALESYLGQYEHVFSILRSRPIITYQSHEVGIAQFLDSWALPQLAVLVHRLKGKFSARTTLHHFEALLVSHETTDMQASSVKSYVKSLVPKTVEPPDFFYALDKVSDRSHKKISTINTELEGLRVEISSSKLTATKQQELLDTIRCAYMAATALSRFSAMYSAARMGSKATLIECFRHHYDAVCGRREPDRLLAAHIRLFDGFIASRLPDASENPHLEHIFTNFSQQIAARSVGEFEPLEQLVLATEEEPRDPAAIKQAFSVLEQHPDYQLFEPFALQLRALMALEAGETAQSLELYRKVLSYSEKQQLGHVVFYAASYAIALEVMQEKPLPHGYQNPLINYRIESELQVNELRVALPTVFTQWRPQPDWPAPVRAVFFSIREFNIDMFELRIPLERLCNPLKKLNGFMGVFFQLLAPKSDEAQFRKLICKAIKGKDRGRSVLSMHTATPYEVLRDEILYAQTLFGGLKLYFRLNPHLRSYHELSDAQKKVILKALSPDRYRHDSQQVR
ncbi:hypothetical protein SAMN03159362_3895 [Pseudomonas sp. NFIX51]|uniref:hypothetical protein n=1 Tax=Pseudomonas TaxID=286 RepID=UPI0008B236EA|nr:MULTISPECIES: hypothetical protein [Pseudomonas]ROL92888.1 hypothetical protein BK637_02585 [Pseudomonas chlororaphis]WDH35354.1 hypothetical protein PUP62_00615 [Pseudomonas chlororaphis]WDH41439.1 hypothetical protein PUP51_00615 [Pseudomonas chlororaphis]SEL66812.1 hypothetical protein SAMN03159414_3092 [Pseudomonas sp. NFACC41-3]SMH55693.1 hypothetical protein SAMN03159362_3895 [Pseudomonas sp. NFIX51]